MNDLEAYETSPAPIPFTIRVWTRPPSARLSEPAADGWQTGARPWTDAAQRIGASANPPVRHVSALLARVGIPSASCCCRSIDASRVPRSTSFRYHTAVVPEDLAVDADRPQVQLPQRPAEKRLQALCRQRHEPPRHRAARRRPLGHVGRHRVQRARVPARRHPGDDRGQRVLVQRVGGRRPLEARQGYFSGSAPHSEPRRRRPRLRRRRPRHRPAVESPYLDGDRRLPGPRASTTG